MIILTPNAMLIYQSCVSLLQFSAIASVYVCAQMNHHILLPEAIFLSSLPSHPAYLSDHHFFVLDSGMKHWTFLCWSIESM